MEEKKIKMRITILICCLFWCIVPCKCSASVSAKEQKLEETRKELTALRSTKDALIKEFEKEKGSMEQRWYNLSQLHNDLALKKFDETVTRDSLEMIDIPDYSKTEKELKKKHEDEVKKIKSLGISITYEITLIKSDREAMRKINDNMREIEKQIEKLEQNEKVLVGLVYNSMS